MGRTDRTRSNNQTVTRLLPVEITELTHDVTVRWVVVIFESDDFREAKELGFEDL